MEENILKVISPLTAEFVPDRWSGEDEIQDLDGRGLICTHLPEAELTAVSERGRARRTAGHEPDQPAAFAPVPDAGGVRRRDHGRDGGRDRDSGKAETHLHHAGRPCENQGGRTPVCMLNTSGIESAQRLVWLA